MKEADELIGLFGVDILEASSERSLAYTSRSSWIPLARLLACTSVVRMELMALVAVGRRMGRLASVAAPARQSYRRAISWKPWSLETRSLCVHYSCPTETRSQLRESSRWTGCTNLCNVTYIGSPNLVHRSQAVADTNLRAVPEAIRMHSSL
jgi:hypothetical protein